VTIKRHWVKTTEDGTRTWDDEQKGGGGRYSFIVPYNPDHTVLSGLKPDRQPYKGEPNPSYWSGDVETAYHYDLRRSRPSDLEAVMIPVGDYDEWWPTAVESEDDAGPKPLTVKVRLHKKGAPNKPDPKRAKFKFELVDTTREKGICLKKLIKNNRPADGRPVLAGELRLSDESGHTDLHGRRRAFHSCRPSNRHRAADLARLMIFCSNSDNRCSEMGIWMEDLCIKEGINIGTFNAS
jgi:hypothetical protein